MNVLEIYSYFVLPILVIAIAGGMYWWATRDGPRQDRRHSA